VPWKASRPMDLKVEFVTRLKKGERMTDLCEEYGIHRQTGYEVWNRYQQRGAEGLLPQSKAPRRQPHKTPDEIVALLIAERKAHPNWGARKLKTIVEEQRDLKLPAASTITSWLKRAGLVEPKKRRRRQPPRPTGLREATAANELWCADYKGQFRLGDHSYCYPLTMTDQHSRFVLACDAMAAIDEDAACETSIDTFKKYGLPVAIRTDNGGPFASTGLAGLSKLSVMWLLQGIELERIEPGQPQQNGRHERMHRTLKLETARPAAANLLQQQQRFDAFVEEFNRVRPHEALDQKRPAALYRPSARPYSPHPPEPDYPLHDDVLWLNSNGVLTFGRGERYHVTTVLAHQPIGVRECADGRWLLTFVSIDLGHLNRRTKKFEPLSSE
jgi:transposase InsO family protein